MNLPIATDEFRARRDALYPEYSGWCQCNRSAEDRARDARACQAMGRLPAVPHTCSACCRFYQPIHANEVTV